jgi:hypothetical protein
MPSALAVLRLIHHGPGGSHTEAQRGPATITPDYLMLPWLTPLVLAETAEASPATEIAEEVAAHPPVTCSSSSAHSSLFVNSCSLVAAVFVSSVSLVLRMT